jgi:hypothetical protein
VSAAVSTLAQPGWAAARSAPELVGRREELAALEDELSRAEEGSFRLVLLVGEPGVGKSRLGRELLARHPEATGLVAQGYPLAASAAFGLWTEAIDPFLQTLSDAEVCELCGGLLDDLASLFHRVALVRGSVPQVCARSQGNPLYAIGLLRALLQPPEGVLAGQLEAARRIIEVVSAERPAGPSLDQPLSEELEAIRWFPLPSEGGAGRTELAT